MEALLVDKFGFWPWSWPKKRQFLVETTIAQRYVCVSHPLLGRREQSFMKIWSVLGMVVLLPLVLRTASLRADDTPTLSTIDLELQVSALTSIDDLDLTAKQLKDLHAMSSDTAGTSTPVPSGGKKDPSYHTAALGPEGCGWWVVMTTRSAMRKTKSTRFEKKLDIDPNGEEIATTGAAKKKADAFLKMLSTSQIANYISMHSDSIPDAFDTIMDAIDQCKEGNEDDFKSLRDEAAQQVALLAAGPEQQADSDVAKKVIELLNKAYKMKDPGKHRDELEEQARQITQSIDSFEAMRRWMLREMADMLSNPQFRKALAMRTKAAAANAKKPSEE